MKRYGVTLGSAAVVAAITSLGTFALLGAVVLFALALDVSSSSSMLLTSVRILSWLTLLSGLLPPILGVVVLCSDRLALSVGRWQFAAVVSAFFWAVLAFVAACDNIVKPYFIK